MTSPELIEYFFKVQGKSTNRCLEPTEKCKRRAIRAHSIPSTTVLTRLECDGHLVILKMKLKVPPPAQVGFERIGKNQATTFTGLCAQHDNGIFRPIDNALPDVANPEHLFLMAYRAVLREFYVVLQNAIRFQATYKKRVEVGLSPGNVPCDYGMSAISHICNACKCYKYKRYYDRIYLANDWTQLKHNVLVFKNQYPSIAVSSLFSLDDVNSTETPRVTLTVFPAGNDVVVAFSVTPNDAPFVDAYLNRFLSSESYLQKYQLSKLVLQHCDNFVIAPDYYDALPQERKDTICQYFVHTILENADDYEDQRLYLF